MIILPPCLFKHTKNDERVAMLFQCLLDYTQQKLYFYLISLLRNDVSKSVYVNSRHCLQRTHLQRPLLKMSPTDGDEKSRGRNPENGRRRDFGRRRHRLSGFQHTDRPRPSSPELLNKDHNAGRESLSHLSCGC